MTSNLREQVLEAFGLTPDQQLAALERERDVAVTAGAGSGKTKTLVARYASLLADGFALRSVVAITFSDKAALEMRSRVRETLNTLVSEAVSEEERKAWVALNAEMDAARISTIHSLCAEILKAHPVEAGIDPKFTVIDEGLGKALKAQIVSDTMDEMSGQAEFAPLFRILEIKPLTDLLAFLLDERLEAQEAFEKDIDPIQAACQGIQSVLQYPIFADNMKQLRSMGSSELQEDAGDKFADQVEELLETWGKAEKLLNQGDCFASVALLYNVRRNFMDLRPGKRDSEAKGFVRILQTAYDKFLDPICGGKDGKISPPNIEAEAPFKLASKLLNKAFEQMTNAYREALRQTGELDFDDLEYGAARLLQQPEIQKQWQGGIAALLVDEFQDTNERQRQIVLNLTCAPGKLFVVGDPKQSIYRFRRADVTVFRSITESVRAAGGLTLALDETFRAHEPLLKGMGDLLEITMGTEDDPLRPYAVPFSPLVAHRKAPEEPYREPHLEFVLGVGDDAESARPVAARALALRLAELKEQGQIRSWDEVTLLFRASTGFPAYEAAFEDTNIPFVTVAGRGFYDRAEIRDVLNILRSLADPSDDLAMAGLLRSPAFGLTDTALYQLRWQAETPSHYWSALQGDLTMLDSEDQLRATRAISILMSLLPLVDRIPVAELLKKVVDATDYRAILAVGDQGGNGGRLWRNLDKLMVDAQDSGKVSVRDFLDYLTTINDAGAREGEAPAEAFGSVRLMTIHKAKGLQFPVVVLADASREPKGGNKPAILLPNLGLAFKLDPAPMLFRLAQQEDQRQEEAEKQRVLYVALTRAQEKLIISGHQTRKKKGGVNIEGYMEELVEAAGFDPYSLDGHPGEEIVKRTSSGQALRAWVMAEATEAVKLEADKAVSIAPEAESLPIHMPLVVPAEQVETEEEIMGIPVERVTVPAGSIPAGVIGQLVHKAIELWLLPEDPRLIPMLETAALNAGLAQKSQRSAAVHHAIDLLARLKDHPLRKEVEAATQIHHELPYSRMVKGHAETGYIDLMYLSPAGWQILDFKTDSIRSTDEGVCLIRRYSSQMRKYASAVETLLGQKVQTRICFLDDRGKIELLELTD